MDNLELYRKVKKYGVTDEVKQFLNDNKDNLIKTILNNAKKFLHKDITVPSELFLLEKFSNKENLFFLISPLKRELSSFVRKNKQSEKRSQSFYAIQYYLFPFNSDEPLRRNIVKYKAPDKNWYEIGNISYVAARHDYCMLYSDEGVPLNKVDEIAKRYLFDRILDIQTNLSDAIRLLVSKDPFGNRQVQD